MNIKATGKSDVGLVREINEDCIRLMPDKNLFIVCDGMGGHNAGEVASKTACDTIATLYGIFFDRLLTDEQLGLPRPFPPSTDVLIKAVRIANHGIYRRAAENPSLSGMGTTIVAIALEKDIATVLHVGDSRVYRFFDNDLISLTVDHSWAAELEQSEQISAEEAKNLVNRNVITRALGVKDNVEIDVSVRKTVENDMYILCSDGLCGYVEDNDIKDVVNGCKGDIDKVVTQLVKLANDRGGMDNVSVVAVQIKGKVESSDHQKLSTVTVAGEPSEYYEAEEQWEASAAIEQQPDEPPESASSGFGGGRILTFVFAFVVVAAVLYFILKG